MTGNSFDFCDGVARPGGLRQRGFRAHINDVRALRGQHPAALDGGFRRAGRRFRGTRIGGQIDHPHDGRPGVEAECCAADGKFRDARGRGGAMLPINPASCSSVSMT